MNDVKMLIIMPWKKVIGSINRDTITGSYIVKNAIIFEDAMTQQGEIIPIPVPLTPGEIKGVDFNVTSQSVIIEPMDVPEKLLALYTQLTSSLIIPSKQQSLFHG
jgi:hypothetical protein